VQPDAVAGILKAISGLQSSIERIETELRSPEHSIVRRESTGEHLERLQKELTRLLENIRNIQILRSDAELSHLRREQARLVFTIESLRRGERCDDSYLT
jgi:septal ring factor EnvC (AmiA/AmiB activator)